ncbi:hypothetical protein B0T24DRAFT_674648 [Lasiosphaeria ovina]|uniref:Uncharacterized protein n=1 Tax=Lasiosphaeria ovina TaxID=92902 RepID=A0AAE0KLD7_9PEZI|nr:hypothetical protein B0T24DRAFT_674648 [Lasiosphaeria ovina]
MAFLTGRDLQNRVRLITLLASSKFKLSESSPREIILSIHPEHVANIVKQVQNNGLGNYSLPETARRVWLYEKSPTSAIQYVATVGHAEKRSEIRGSSVSKNDRFGFEIEKLERLPTLFSPSSMYILGLLKAPPQKYCFMNSAMAQAIEKNLEASPLELVFDSGRPTLAALIDHFEDLGATLERGSDVGAEHTADSSDEWRTRT